MRSRLWILANITVATAALSGCMMPGRVQRATVEYNSAVYGMSNQLTLLNIARAKEGLPTFYTSVSRLSGSISVKGAAGFNAALKADQPTLLNSTTTQGVTENTTSAVASGNPSNTTGTRATDTLTTLVQRTVAQGGNIYTPSVSGEISSGPSFDIQILDTQQFYRGILAGIDGPTFMNFIDQGTSGDLVLHLLVYRVVFKATEKVGPFEKGQVVHTWTNAPLDTPGSLNDLLAERFWPIASCYALTTQTVKGEETRIAQVSRVARARDGSVTGLPLADLAALDGSQLALRVVGGGPPVDKADVYVGSLKTPDNNLVIVKPGQSKQMAALYQRPADAVTLPQCLAPDDKRLAADPSSSAFHNGAMFVPKPDSSGESADNKSSSKGVLRIYTGDTLVYTVPVQAELVPRSTEAVVQYLGAYIRKDPRAGSRFLLNGAPLFSMPTKCKKEIVGVDLGDEHYCIEHDDNRGRNMQIVALVEQLINLNKAGTDRPTTVPVQVIP